MISSGYWIRTFVKWFLRLSLRAYYRSVQVQGLDQFPKRGPVLLVANHPNSLVDPAILIHVLPRRVRFGARHGLFWGPLRPILDALGAIPLYRLQDAPRAQRQNLVAIDRYSEQLCKDRVAAIFPEGYSHDDPHVAPIKSGAARIALQAEATSNFKLGLNIVPIGLQFEPRRRFRSDAFVRLGVPFTFEDLDTLHERVPRQAVRELTERIELALKNLTFHVDSTEHIPFIERLVDIYFRRVKDTGLTGVNKKGLRGELLYRMAACLNHYLKAEPAAVAEIEDALERYETMRAEAGANRRLLEESPRLLPGPLAIVQTALGDTVSIEQVGGNRFAPNLNLNSTDQRVVVLAARRFAGQTIAFSYDWARSSGDIDTRYELLPNGVPLTSESARTRFKNLRRQFVFGYHKESDSIGSLGLFYRVGSFSGRTGQTEHLLDQQPAPLARFTDGGISQEAGIKWRKMLHRNLSIGVGSSLQYARLNGITRDYRIADTDGERRFWVPRLGVGVGGTFADRFQYSIDYQHSFVAANSLSQQVSDGNLVTEERVRRTDHTLHSWLQVQLPASFFAGGGLTSFWSAEEFKGRFEIDAEGKRMDSQGQARPAFVRELSLLQLTQPGFSVGRRFGESFFLQYFLSSTIGPQFRPTSHGVLFRLAF